MSAWLEQIKRGIKTLGSLEAGDFGESTRAFVELTQFIADHSRQQYRALQTMIWSALFLLMGIAAILARLYAQNLRLAASLNTAIDPLTLPAKKAVVVGIIINEGVANAVKHGFGADEPNVLEVTLKQGRDGHAVVLTVSNSSRRLPANFSVDNASSLGLQLVSGLAEQLSGTLESQSEPMTALGVEFRLSG